MDYKAMWEQLKEHHQKRYEKHKDVKFKSTMNPRTISKSIVDSMGFIEHQEKQKKL